MKAGAEVGSEYSRNPANLPALTSYGFLAGSFGAGCAAAAGCVIGCTATGFGAADGAAVDCAAAGVTDRGAEGPLFAGDAPAGEPLDAGNASGFIDVGLPERPGPGTAKPGGRAPDFGVGLPAKLGLVALREKLGAALVPADLLPELPGDAVPGNDGRPAVLDNNGIGRVSRPAGAAALGPGKRVGPAKTSPNKIAYVGRSEGPNAARIPAPALDHFWPPSTVAKASTHSRTASEMPAIGNKSTSGVECLQISAMRVTNTPAILGQGWSE